MAAAGPTLGFEAPTGPAAAGGLCGGPLRLVRAHREPLRRSRSACLTAPPAESEAAGGRAGGPDSRSGFQTVPALGSADLAWVVEPWGLYLGSCRASVPQNKVTAARVRSMTGPPPRVRSDHFFFFICRPFRLAVFLGLDAVSGEKFCS